MADGLEWQVIATLSDVPNQIHVVYNQDTLSDLQIETLHKLFETSLTTCKVTFNIESKGMFLTPMGYMMYTAVNFSKYERYQPLQDKILEIVVNYLNKPNLRLSDAH